MSDDLRQLTIAETGVLESANQATRIRDMVRRAGLSDSSMKRYAPYIQSWETYCAFKGQSVWDASTETLLHWLDHQLRAHQTASHMALCLCAVRHAQRIYAPEDASEVVPYSRDSRPRLDAFIAEVMRLSGTEPTKQARPLRGRELQICVQHLRVNARTRRGVPYLRAMQLARRNAAALLVGWWGALRGAELANLQWDDVFEVDQGIELYLRTSKTGPAKVALCRQPRPEDCPVIALNDWRRSALSDPLNADLTHLVFQMTNFNVIRLVRGVTRDAGVGTGYTGHSLRAGFATEAAAQGADDRDVMRHARWRSRGTHDRYVRTADLWEHTPTRTVILSA